MKEGVKGECRTEACGRPAFSRGVCRRCYNSWWWAKKLGAISDIEPRPAHEPARERLREREKERRRDRQGVDRVAWADRTPEDIQAWIWQRVMPEPHSGCWIWMGQLHAHRGYGHITNPGAPTSRAHRLSYTAHKGDLPAGTGLHHRCENKLCCALETILISIVCAAWIGRICEAGVVAMAERGRPLAHGRPNLAAVIVP